MIGIDTANKAQRNWGCTKTMNVNLLNPCQVYNRRYLNVSNILNNDILVCQIVCNLALPSKHEINYCFPYQNISTNRNTYCNRVKLVWLYV